MQSEAMRRSGVMKTADDDAERSDAEERRNENRRRRCRAKDAEERRNGTCQ
jgi:hypothetical protein